MSTHDETTQAVTLELPVQLTEAEKVEGGHALAELLERSESIAAVLKAASTKAREEQVELLAQIKPLVRMLSEGAEMREIACTITRDFAGGRVVTSRDDTGEIVKDREMTDAERQGTLGVGEGEG